MSANRDDCLWYSTIVYITIALFTLEEFSRKGHMKSPTECLEQKLNQTKTFSKASSIANFVNLPQRQLSSLK